MQFKNFSAVLAVILLFGLPLHAQQLYNISGLIKDNVNEPLIGATIALYDASGDFVGGTAADLDGHFILNDIKPGTYNFKVTYLGFDDFQKALEVSTKSLHIGIVKMGTLKTTALNEVSIVEKAPPVQQRGDTTQFNAGSYKVNPDATAEDLIRKMPGMDMSSGKANAQGEQVAKVLVDGKPFFGDDPSSALKNLPAEVIDKIQVYDERSEQSQFTGFDDGNTSKTINIITKSGKRQGVFGRVYGAYGYQDKYNGGGNVNYFEGDRRISLVGLANNINIQNFSSEDLVGVSSGGGGGRGGRGGPRGGGDGSNAFSESPQNGIATTNAIGLNYSDKWGEKIDVTGSYFYNNSKAVANELTRRNFVLPSQEGQSYEDTSYSDTRNTNHRFNLRLNYQIDSSNSILFIPRLSFQNNSSNSSLLGQTMQDNTDVLNRMVNNFQSERDGYNMSSMFLYRHKFKKRGRTFSLWANGGLNKNDAETKLYSINDRIADVDTVDQQAYSVSDGWNINTNLNYTEPLSNKSSLQAQYGIRYQQSASDKRTYNPDRQTGDYTVPDTLLSNVFNTEYMTHKAGLTYRFSDTSFNFNVGLDVQQADLVSERVLPYAGTLQRSFQNLLPSARFQYNFDKKKNLMLFYRTSTDAPSVTQLQDVINNANSLQLSSGNPDLIQSYQHRVNIRYNATNIDKGSTFFAMLSGSMTQDYIANSTLIAEDTMTLDGGILLGKGGQYSRPVNMDGYRNLRSFVTYGMPLNLLKSNLNINAGAGLTRTPGLINQQENFANNTNVSLGLVLSSNISEQLDFTLSSNSNLNFVKNTLNTNSDNQYFNQSSRLSLNYIFWKGIVFNTELNHQLYTGLSAGFDQNYLLWNMSVAKKLFRQQQAEIRLSVFDLLAQNTSVNRTITEAYSQDVISNVLQQYFMLTFTYNLRFFKNGASMKDANRPSEGGGPGGPGGPPHGMPFGPGGMH